MLDESKPVWILKDARPYGPFPILMVGRDHVIVKTPYDKRLWVDAERVCDSSLFKGKEIFPISCVTQDKENADAWRVRNEPRIGDLVSVVHYDYQSVKRLNGSSLERVTLTTEGIVGACTEHQIRLFSPGALVERVGLLRARAAKHTDRRGSKDPKHLGRHVSKDACIVLSRDESMQFQVEKAAKQQKDKKSRKPIPAK